ncbi:TPA: hypothetical protein ACFM7A_001882 [Neisseria meningitidis]|uniref:DUF6911 family protein n=1 Tax=Neisseria meningitidis TaxID=487 RepID=UPI00027CAD21|nr:hypothetical protein [Neisseria meningitidis]EJU51556.1 hypothetical protein NMEN93004_2096 [Neisseria meningitidis 93004]
MKTSTVVFGGFFITDNGERIQIPVLENPDIREINHFFSVSNFEKKTGVLVFRIIPEPEFGNTELTIYFEKGYYSGLTKTSTALPRLAVLVFVNPLYQTKTNTRANSLTATRQSKCRLKQLGLSDGISFA